MGRRKRRSTGGVSDYQVGPNKWKLTWRQNEVHPDTGTRFRPDGKPHRKQRYTTVYGVQGKDELMAEIRRQLAVQGYYEPGVKPEELDCNLERAALAWIRHKKSKGRAPGTIQVYKSGMKRWFATVRAIEGISTDAAVPGSVLSTRLLDDARNRWAAEGLSEARRYDLSRWVYEIWRWAADAPDEWPGIPRPPRDAQRVLSEPPVKGAPLDPPTWAEVDAVITQSRVHTNPLLATMLAVQRYTGLRRSQVRAIQVRDLDLDRATLKVRKGKSRREKHEQRVIPVTRHLLDLLAPLMAERPAPTSLVFPSPQDPSKGYDVPSNKVRDSFEAATVAGNIRRHVWNPENKKNRTTHAFRAALMHELRERGVRDHVIHRLVGHSPTTTMDRHYAPPSMKQLRDAVDRIEPIDMGNVVEIGRGAA